MFKFKTFFFCFRCRKYLLSKKFNHSCPCDSLLEDLQHLMPTVPLILLLYVLIPSYRRVRDYCTTHPVIVRSDSFVTRSVSRKGEVARASLVNADGRRISCQANIFQTGAATASDFNLENTVHRYPDTVPDSVPCG
jgi:hypothetical protein